MKSYAEDSVGILKLAAKRELETRDFYKSCYEQAKLNAIKKILELLIADEDNHYRIVMDIIAYSEQSKNTVPSVSYEKYDPKIILEQSFPHSITKDNPGEYSDLNALLLKAKENEKESFNIYSNAAGKSDNSEIKDICAFLAKQENMHYNMIDNIIDFIGDPSNWIYEEENLIFNL